MSSSSSSPTPHMHLNKQIIDLVNRLNPQTQGLLYQELEQLIKSYGYETYKCLLRALIDKVDDGHHKLNPQDQQADNTRIELLKHVFNILMQQDNFVNIAVEVFDSFQQASKAELIRLLSAKLQFSSYQTILMALSLLQSQIQQSKLDGAQIIKEEIFKNSSDNASSFSLPDTVANHLLYTIQNSPLFERERDSLVNQLRSLLSRAKAPAGAMGASPAAVAQQQQSPNPLLTNPQYPQQQHGGVSTMHPGTMDPKQLQNEMRLGRLFREIGYIATASEDAVRDVFKIFQKDLGGPNAKLSVQTVSCLVGELVSTHQGLNSSTDAFQHFLRQYLDADTASKYSKLQNPGTWEMDNLATVLKEFTSHLDWSQVIERLDYPDFRLPDKKSLALLALVHDKASGGSPFPIEKVISRPWNNREAQLQFCILGLGFPPSTLNYSSENLREVNVGEKLLQSSSQVQHVAWSNVEFIETLLNLADGDKFSLVQELFEKAIEKTPERIFIGILEAQPRNRMLQSNLILSSFVPKYINEKTPSDRDALAVLDQFLLVNPLLFSMTFSELFNRDNSSIDMIAQILQALKATELVLACAHPKFSTYLAITSSAKQSNLLNFSLWLKSVLVLNGPAYLPAFIEYLQQKLPTIDLNQKEQKNQLEYIAPLFRWIPLLNSNISTGDLQRVISSNAAQIPNQVWEEILRLQHKPAFSVPKDIENNADEHLKKIFKGAISIENATDLLKQMKQSSNDVDKKLYACMIHNLFDEYRFFPNYTDQDLAKASSLFGAIISHDIIKGKSLELAKYFIFTALRSNDTRMLQFALVALNQFKNRLHEWPHFCSHLKTLPATTFAPIPDLLQEVESTLRSASTSQRKNKKAGKDSSKEESSSEAMASIHGEMRDAQTLVLHDGEEIQVPDEDVRNNMGFMFNNLSTGSAEVFDEKAKQLKSTVEEKYYPYLCYYLVVDRASKELGHQNTYVQLVAAMKDKKFEKRIMYQTYKAINTLLGTPLRKEHGQQRKTLKILGEWLARLTLARSKPILVKELDLQQLLLESFETGKLPAIAAFVGKVMSHVLNSDAFKPPNPWTMMLLSLLKEIHDHPEVDLSVRFDVEILCKNLGIKLQDIPVREEKFLANLKLGHYAGTPAPSEREFDPSCLPEVSIQLPELNNDVKISPTLDIFQQYPALKVYVVYALEQAIREVIPPVVKRSITIACRTALELVTKDFIFDADATKFRRSAVLMASGLASKLSLVTGKDPLQTSLHNHLKAYLDAAVITRSDALAQKIEETCRIITEANVGLGCVYVEENAKEKASQTILEALATEIDQRNKCYASGGQVPWTLTAQNPCLRQMPEALVSPHGVQGYALHVYETFAKSTGFSVGTPTDSRVGGAHPQMHQQHQQHQQQFNAAPQSLHAAHLPPPQSQSSTKMTFEEAAETINKYLRNMMAHAQKLKQDTRLSSLRPESDIVKHLLLVGKLLRQCDDVHKISTFVADNMLRMAYDPNRNQNLFMRDIYIHFLKTSTEVSPEIVREISVWWRKLEDQNQKYGEISLRFLLDRILDYSVVDDDLPQAISRGDMKAASFAVDALREGTQVDEPPYKPEHFADTLTQLSSITNQLPQESASLVSTLYSKAVKGMKSVIEYHMGIRNSEVYISKFQDFMQLYNKNPTVTQIEQFISKNFQSTGLLSTDTDFGNLCKSLTKYVVDHFYFEFSKLKQLNMQATTHDSESVGSLFNYIDGYTRLVMSILMMSHDNSRFELLDRTLSVAMKFTIRDHEVSPAKFNQRPYERMFSNYMVLLHDTHEENAYRSILGVFAQKFFLVRPQMLPGFAFAWIDLISHRLFMPELLQYDGEDSNVSRQNFFELLRVLFKFLKPQLVKQKLSEPVKHLYKATLRILLVLLHDFSEFLCEYHFSLCDEIAPNCIQMRNLVLSAFPRHMRLPDPFTPNLKVDLLPDIKESPTILSDYTTALENNNLKKSIDFYLENRNQPQTLHDLIPSLLLPTAKALQTGQRYNVELINALVLHLGIKSIESPNAGSNTDMPAMDVFKKLMYELDSEGRYHLLNAIANQLRYPNSHTYYYSRVILYLFGYVKLQDDEELIQEQITRVVFERLIANRPHPWGLLVTFIELVRNRTYGFYDKEFIRCAPEISAIFNNVRPAVDKET